MDAPTVYAEQLALTKRKLGHALWEPDYTGAIAPEIGSIGFIRNGKWQQIDRLTDLKVSSDIQRRTLRAAEPIVSTSIRRVEFSSQASVGTFAVQFEGDLRYTCSKDCGAVLAIGDDANRVDALNIDYFRTTMSREYSSWLHKANVEKQYGIEMHELILVTGCDKTSSAWETAVFQGVSSDFQLSIACTAAGFGSAGFSAMIKELGPRSRMSDRNWGQTRSRKSTACISGDVPNTSVTPAPRDQCIFLRGCKILSRNFLERLWQKRKMIEDGMYISLAPEKRRKTKPKAEIDVGGKDEDDSPDSGPPSSSHYPFLPPNNSQASSGSSFPSGPDISSGSSGGGTRDQSAGEMCDVSVDSEDEDENGTSAVSPEIFSKERFTDVYESLKHTQSASSTTAFATLLETLNPLVYIENGVGFVTEKKEQYLRRQVLPLPTLFPDGPSSDNEQENLTALNKFFSGLISSGYSEDSVLKVFIS
ncbi:hypothetical protein M422DRAFT_67844 [Sphaerobolus stellatus SS14]|uniref:Uncharacterized protein n=1 Tax=Sphaerobolus stellatus (strain SS14) TaxID=990650 RepID=A0A0C9UKB4_SPHS4|nr:hypothetical protein M422DRAFT_67844 [Sphaerobolus stellatus SS14]